MNKLAQDRGAPGGDRGKDGNAKGNDIVDIDGEWHAVKGSSWSRLDIVHVSENAPTIRYVASRGNKVRIRVKGVAKEFARSRVSINDEDAVPVKSIGRRGTLFECRK